MALQLSCEVFIGVLHHVQAQWAQAVTHENEKLHQLTGLQGAIVASLQEGHASADAACRHAKELARTSQRAKRASQEAGQLHSSLLQHTGHAKASLTDLPQLLHSRGKLF